MRRILRYNSTFLGAMIAVFGVLKFFEPFHGWFHIQITNSGLPAASIPLGMGGEMSIGLALLLAPLWHERLGPRFRPIIAVASAGLVVMMGVATYVHLRPAVPAAVLPLGIKPPIIPLTFMALAGWNLLLLFAPGGGSTKASPAQ